MRNKLAIVGCALRTRDQVDYSDPDLDIWVLNESAQKEWVKRCDAVIQMHHESIWKSPVNRGDTEHGQWLMSGNTPDIYMLEKYPDVPKAICYPKDEIVAALLSSLTVDSERARKDYFTSSVAYAYALAIHLGYREVHTYGVELMDEEEYREQKPCAMFWNGVAVGRGVKWVSHSQMFDEPLYPLETYVGLDMRVFLDKVNRLNPQCEAAKNAYQAQVEVLNKAIERYEQGGAEEAKRLLVEALKDTVKVSQDFALLDGERQEAQRYYGRARAMKGVSGSYVFSRHEFVRDQAAMGVRRQNEALPRWNAIGAQVQGIIDQIEPKRFDSNRRGMFRQLRETIFGNTGYIRAGVEVAMYTGAMKADDDFIALMDAERNKAKAGG